MGKWFERKERATQGILTAYLYCAVFFLGHPHMEYYMYILQNTSFLHSVQFICIDIHFILGFVHYM